MKLKIVVVELPHAYLQCIFLTAAVKSFSAFEFQQAININSMQHMHLIDKL